MARPMYTITASDVTHARAYLEPRIRNFDVGIAENVSHRSAERAFAEAAQEPRKEKRAALLNAWCEKYLSSDEWSKLKLAIRKRRERRIRTDQKTVTISGRAYSLLAKLALRDEVTYSEALEKHLQRALNAKRR